MTSRLLVPLLLASLAAIELSVIEAVMVPAILEFRAVAAPVEPPRPAHRAIPAVLVEGPVPSTGVTTEREASGTEDARTPATRNGGGSPVLRGRASWYRAPASVAAAGPALRKALGAGWRGTWVRVSAGGRSVAVRLSDWCQCYRGTPGERVIDLSDDDFAVLAPLASGIVRVRITALVPPATDTE